MAADPAVDGIFDPISDHDFGLLVSRLAPAYDDNGHFSISLSLRTGWFFWFCRRLFQKGDADLIAGHAHHLAAAEGETG